MARRSRSRRRSVRTAPRPSQAIAFDSGAIPSLASRVSRLPRITAAASYARRIEPYRALPRRMAQDLLRALRVQSTRSAKRSLSQRVPEGLLAPRISRNPKISRSQSVCQRRQRRKETMFALGVAGRRWGRGGPRMQRARHTYESSYTCRR